MKTQTKQIQDSQDATIALHMLVEGNKRFVNNLESKRNLLEQVKETSSGQYPFAVVLSCIDSRVPAELIFDQGIGDIFSVRVAGNIVNEDVLGSIEYSCKVAGSKVVVVLGHTKCGAVTAACKNVELGNITSLLQKIKPAVNEVRKNKNIADKEELNDHTIEDVTVKNVALSIAQIKKESPILAAMEKDGDIEIVGAVYNVANGQVEFL